jgi:hypothetical protein
MKFLRSIKRWFDRHDKIFDNVNAILVIFAVGIGTLYLIMLLLTIIMNDPTVRRHMSTIDLSTPLEMPSTNAPIPQWGN